MLFLVLSTLFVFLSLLFIRVARCTPIFLRRLPAPPRASCKSLVVLGSGGHTGEMTSLLHSLDRNKFKEIDFVLAETDSTSMERVIACGLAGEKSMAVTAFHKIPRSREVGQSWFTTVFTTFRSFMSCLVLVAKLRPDLVICNGPGTCMPVCVAALLLRIVGLQDSRIVFVESFCRVKTLSFTGKLLYRLADRFVVQWPGLTSKYPRAEYIGKIY